ncbi:hypothetical protein [Stenotrophomonas acidaminiphila]
MQYGIGKAVGAPGTHWNNGDVLADAFGNALGSALGASTKARLEERQKLQQMGAQAEAHREQLLGMMYGQSGAQGAGSAGFDSTDTFRDRYPYALASSGGMSSGRGGASFPGAVGTRRSAALTANTRPVEDIPTLDPVYAVPDIHSSGGWYFYSWNSAGQRWVDPRKSVINPAVEDWSMPPHQWLNAYGMSKDGGWKMPGVQVAGPGLANRNLPVWAAARPSLKVASAAELPAIENMYTPRVGAWERAYQEYVQGMSDPNLGWVGQGLGLLGAVGTAIPMMADSMISGLWNAPNNAGIAGQKIAQASMLTGHERNIALLEGGLSFIFGFLGVGDVVTLGQSGMMARTARISSEMPIGGVANKLPALSTTELQALRTAGLSEAEIARHIELSGDIHLFRGTSTGWAGSPGAQATAVSASTDPYVATVFALEARGQGGQAVLMFGERSKIGTFDMGNWMAVQEREVGVLMSAHEFANRAPFSMHVDNARSLLMEMGMPQLPYSVPSPAARSILLDSAPKMTPEQVAEFIKRSKNGG